MGLMQTDVAGDNPSPRGKKKPVRGNGLFTLRGGTREFSVVGYRKFTIKPVDDQSE